MRNKISMQKSRFIQMGVATTAVAGLVLGGAAAASAAGMPTGLQAVKAKAHTAVTDRVGRLNTTIASVNGMTFLGADQAALVAKMNTDVTGLTQLDATIQADTTLEAAKTDAKKIFTDFRIYALVVPSTRMVVAADAVQGVAVTKLSAAADRLQAIITKRGATDLQPKLDDMKAQIAAAQTVTAGTSAHLQTLTPAEWNANHDLLSADRANLATARTDLRTARADAKAIVAGLRQK